MRTLPLFTFVALLIINDCCAQTSSEMVMKNTEYQHSSPPSFKAKLIQATMGFFGVRKSVEKKMMTNSFEKAPANPPKSMLKQFNVEVFEQHNRKVWEIAPKSSTSDIVVLYLHGGAYMGNINAQHWDLIAQLCRETNVTYVIPDYPLAAEATYKETYAFIEVLYAKLTTDNPTKRIVIMGDSAGGGLAFGFVQQLRNEQNKQPLAIILLSPWLDISMTNPDIQLYEKKDKLLSVEGLKSAGQKYAGALDLMDYKVSPLYGDYSGLCRITVFTGTHDILHADARMFKEKMNEQSIPFNYFEYPNMFHDWIIVTGIKESRDAISKIAGLINGYGME